MTDPIADMLTRIRNAQAVRKPEVVLPFSKLKMAVAEILKEQDYIRKIEKIEKGNNGGNHEELKLILKYQGSQPAISMLKKISKPGRRIYVTADKLPVVLNNFGIAIISTSNGLMTNKEAKKKKLGGEVICEIH
ncbi:MAG: 30S ribosomal protein S8 [Parcubacteria group bacterium]|nr:30S ribosomal protein S8 [Parcubacteria group bacterium]|tara:strand:- start:18643 stop:19044 length:402 start_codon:yes stop_codon:yes gene_type:complete